MIEELDWYYFFFMIKKQLIQLLAISEEDLKKTVFLK